MARTQSAIAHKKVLDAAVELVGERGIEATSMDAIAARSGVSKATIYKHWKDKEALLLEMLAVLNGLNERPAFDSGNVRADIIAVLSYHPPASATMRERIMPHLIAYSARNKVFGLSWRKMIMEPPRRELRHLLRTGIEKGELHPDVDNDLSLAMLLGPLMYWHVFLRQHEDSPGDLPRDVVNAFWRAYGVEPPQRGRRR
jgi:AcrR family transcriptional regulator